METTNAIQQIYIGLLGRAADQEGLQYWTDEIEAGTLTLEQLRANIVEEQPEYEATFGGQTRAQVVSQLYANLFNRAPDDEGLQYWVNGEGASVNIDQLVLALVNGAAAADTLVLDNRTEVANYYTEELGAEGSFDAELAGAVIADVDGTRASVTQAKASVDNGDITAPTPNEGNTFTLTDAIGETVTGTAGNDTFTAVVGGTDATLNVGDQVLGGGGTDTINLFAGSTVATENVIPTGAELSSIEVVNLRQDDSTFGTEIDATDLGADAKQIWQIGDAVAINSLAEGQIAGFRNTDASVTATYANGVTAGTVALDNVDDASTVDVAGANVTSLTVSGSVDDDGVTPVAGPGTLTLTDSTTSTDGVTDLTISLTSNTLLDISSFTDATSVDLSGSTGNIGNATTRTDLTALAELETYTGSAGRDFLSVDLGDNNTSFDLGAGADNISIAATAATGDENALSVTLGAGNDVAVVSALTNVADATEEDFLNSLVTIEDFNVNQDTLDVTGFTFSTQNLITVDQSASLFDNLTAIAGDMDQQQVQFEFGGDLYIYNDVGTDGFNDGDGLIKLAGVEELLTTGDNLIV